MVEQLMQAWGFNAYGPIDVLHEMQLLRVTPQSHEVEIQLKYAAVNPIDYKIREGYLKDSMPYVFPIVSGWDGAGVISRVGSEVGHWKVGDEVFGYFRPDVIHAGTYAEYITASIACIAKKPHILSFREAVAFPLTALTAWQALFDVAHLKRGQTALIHAAAGGVGGIAVQLAHAIGARVIGSASAKNHPYVTSLGADFVIDYTNETPIKRVLEIAPQGVDFVLDCAGGKIAEESLPLIKKGGSLVSIVNRQVQALASEDLSAEFIFVAPNTVQLNEISQMIVDKKIQVPTLTEFSFREAKEAQRLIQTGRTQGKLIIHIQG